MKLLLKSLLPVFLLFAFAIQGKSQQYRNDISVRDQLVNNSVPGFKYAPTTNTKPANVSKPAAAVPVGIQLPSDMSPEQRKAELEKSAQANKITPVPTQGNVVPEQKPATVLPLVKIPTQEETAPVEKKKEQ